MLGSCVKDRTYALNEARDILGWGLRERRRRGRFLIAQGPVLVHDGVESPAATSRHGRIGPRGSVFKLTLVKAATYARDNLGGGRKGAACPARR